MKGSIMQPVRQVADTVIPSRRRAAAQWRRLKHAFPDDVVRSGPFVGARFPECCTGCDFPKRLGSYELELHSLIEKWDYGRVIDVGCGEGWYLVGLGRRMPHAEIYGFDLSVEAQELSRRNLRINGLHAEVGGLLGAEELARLLEAETLLIMDIEGGEADLLDPSATPELAFADILVETHDFARPGVELLLRERFADRPIDVIRQSPRDPHRYADLAGLAPDDQALVLDESRHHDNAWLWIQRGIDATRP